VAHFARKASASSACWSPAHEHPLARFSERNFSPARVELICETLGVSASAYYQRATGKRSARQLADERLLVEIRRVHRENYECYGSRRVWKQLGREGIDGARCTVERLMAGHGIQGAKRRGKPWRTTKQDPAGADAPDLVERDFSAEAPNQDLREQTRGIQRFTFVAVAPRP